jgi:hypothetical protein
VEAQLSGQIPKAREGDPRNHRADACESVQVTSNYMANLGQDAHRQRACDKGQLRTQARGFSHIGKYLYLILIGEVTLPPKIVPRCSSGWYEVMHNSKRLIKHPVLGIRYPVTHVHVIPTVCVEAADLLQGGASC